MAAISESPYFGRFDQDNAILTKLSNYWKTMRSVTSTDAKANFGDLVASLKDAGSVQITNHGRPVAILHAPPPTKDSSDVQLRLAARLYSEGSSTWPDIRNELDISYGELLQSLADQGLHIPRGMAKKRPEQTAIFMTALDRVRTK